ncbi:hypothetical protein B0H19DRAFT_581789 [Mycena capillaripes]|nr:hypothetical protein B0H19DRAFT_581789 [Mycena capillaripes]
MEVSRAPPAVQALRASTSHHNLALRGQVSVAAPGRILNEAYESFGRLAESHANRAGYRLGFGPVAVVERIQKFMGEGLERESRLQEISNNPSPKLRRDCSKLIGYAFPSESSRTQAEAFKGIVTLVTHYSALRRIFLECKKLQAIEISADIISESWRRPDGNSQAELLTFFLEFAAACIAGKDIAPMMEDNPPTVISCLRLRWNIRFFKPDFSSISRRNTRVSFLLGSNRTHVRSNREEDTR